MALPAYGQAVTTKTAADPAPVEPAGTTVMLELPTWLSWGNFQTAVGYRDNVLLSSADEERSTFVRGGLTATLTRPAYDERGGDFTAYFAANGTYYFSASSLHKESDARLLLLGNYRPLDSVKLTLIGSGYSLDQIFDVSETEFRKDVSEVKTSGASLAPSVRWNFARAWWLSAEVGGKRENSPGGYYNRTVRNTEVRLGWKPGARFEISVAGQHLRRDYDVREQTTLGGAPIPDTLLGTTDRQGELRVEFKPDAAGHWRITTRLIAQRFADNGTGYWNFRAHKIEPEVEWESGAWRASLGGYARRVEFSGQTVGFGVAPPLRVRDDYEARLHVEHDLTKRWTVFAEYTWERNRSNDIFTSYFMNEGLLGVRWNWEK